MNRVKKINFGSKGLKPFHLAGFAVLFAAIGGYLLIRTQASAGLCSTAGVVGTATYAVSAPETAQYKVWVRMQVPDATNTNNTNGVRLELAGSTNQCFTVTTTNQNAVNQWQWINSDALASSTPHVTSQITAGSYTATILGLKSGVKVDKVLLIKSDSTCVPSNDFTNGSPGDNCTTPAPAVTLGANPTSVTSGGTTTLTWSTTNATTCTASGGWSGAKTTSGTFTTSALTSNQSYTLTCNGVGGSGNATVNVTVTPVPTPTLTLTANPTSVFSGGSSTLTWSTTNATTCTANGNWTGAKATSGSESTGNLTSNRSYSLTCTGAGGSVTQSVTVTVTSTPPVTDTTPPTVTMNVDGVTLTSGQTKVTITNTKSFVWRPTASDSSGLKSLVLTVNNQVVTLTNGSITLGASANGDFNLQAVATDNADNVTTATLQVRLRHPDFNRSGKVDVLDMSLLLNRWNTTTIGYDINTNDKVDLFDLTFVLNKWGSTN